ncbi:N,N-dimethylformamidase beta subunit family domain-containing protein [Saliphagus sp. LR7]|uniref:N,N-dimethylformamidase beta subunit family domain-containing protein n=1 Tax=Saliphagus sp. LR7 TaxID=2282654 RepID=UPI0018E4FB9B|nr:N,N-dimethylformamidase beta subunit family domain-containing protein [Saliphagus sp. LR7]
MALNDVQLEFRRDGNRYDVVRSTPRGAVYADVGPGTYDVTLAKDGYGSKHVMVDVDDDTHPYQFRLLSDRLYGYMTPICSTAGDLARFRVHATEEVRVTLWRYGEHRERIRPLDWHGEHGPQAGKQLLPDGDLTQSGVKWHPPHPGAFATQTVEARDRTGLYYVHLEEKESGEFFSFPWVVAPAEPDADVAVVAATMTWNAYNNFGGRSNYVNPASLPDRPVVDSHLDLDRYDDDPSIREGLYGAENHEYAPLSFERPAPYNAVDRDTDLHDPIRGRFDTYFAPAEWRFLGWLETRGYDYDLYADNQLHDGTLDLDAYDVLVIHTHPEYWSRTMYDRVKDWVFERGGQLAYLGGNGIDCEVDVVDETRVRYLNKSRPISISESGKYEGDTPRSRGDEYETRFDRTHESAGRLLGVVTTLSGLMTAAPYEVVTPEHWVFDGTGLESHERFGTETLQERISGGASGQETDKLSRYAPESVQLLAKGANPNDGGAEMVYYETDSDGAVFSVGSITYPAALLVDDHTATITENVLDRFLTGE